MIYPYLCSSCEHSFDVIKSLGEINTEEICEKCGNVATRTIGRFSFAGASDWKPEFNPAFGCVVKSKRHQREILSRFSHQGKEFIEIGNEPVEKLHKKFDSQREAAHQARWSESSDKIIGEVLRS